MLQYAMRNTEKPFIMSARKVHGFGAVWNCAELKCHTHIAKRLCFCKELCVKEYSNGFRVESDGFSQ